MFSLSCLEPRNGVRLQHALCAFKSVTLPAGSAGLELIPQFTSSAAGAAAEGVCTLPAGSVCLITQFTFSQQLPG